MSSTPAHVDARPAKPSVNVIRSVKPVSLSSHFPSVTLPPPLSCSFHLCPVFTSSGGEQSSLAIQMGSCVIVCLCICMCNLRVRERVGEYEGADGEVAEWGW